MTRDPRFAIVDENELCPELRRDPDTSNAWPRHNRGWHRQQLIKLAIHERVATPFYLTLDADIITARRCRLADLVRDGRALYGTETQADYGELYTDGFAPIEMAIKHGRIADADRVLGVHGGAGLYSETPLLLCTSVVGKLAAHLEARHRMPWREALLQHLPWTEVYLYFRFAETAGLLESHHVAGGRNAVLRLDSSLWQLPERYADRRTLASWDTARAFAPHEPGCFVAVQSYLGHRARDVANKVKLVVAVALVASCGSSRMFQEQPIEQPVPTASRSAAAARRRSAHHRRPPVRRRRGTPQRARVARAATAARRRVRAGVHDRRRARPAEPRERVRARGVGVRGDVRAGRRRVRRRGEDLRDREAAAHRGGAGGQVSSGGGDVSGRGAAVLQLPVARSRTMYARSCTCTWHVAVQVHGTDRPITSTEGLAQQVRESLRCRDHRLRRDRARQDP